MSKSLTKIEKIKKQENLSRHKEAIISKHDVFIGIDIGLSCTGLCILERSHNRIRFYSFESDKSLLTIDRIRGIILFIKPLVSLHCNVIVGIEKPFGIKGSGLILLELLGILKYTLRYDYGFEIVDISQSSLKLFAVGKGNAQKSDLVKQAYKEFKIEAETEDEIDAFFCAKFVQMINLNQRKGKQYRKDCVDKVMKGFTI